MGDISQPTPVLLLIAVSSRYEAALTWAEQRAVQEFGPVLLRSEAFDFTETDYYQATMGEGLKKQFLTFQSQIDPGRLPEIKIATNDWEQEFAEQFECKEPRPLNLDPGYLTLAKLILASTKDHAHRIYLGQGIYAETTLKYRSRAWQTSAWTFPDYQREDFQAYFTQCRQAMRG